MRLAGLLALCCALVLPAAGAAANRTTGADVPEIAWGAADDASKFADDGGLWFYGQLAGASLTQNRWTVAFDSSNPTAINELPFLERAAPVAQAAGVRVILVLFSLKGSQHDPIAVLRLGAAGRADGEPVGHPRLRRRQRGEHAPLLVAAEGREGQGRRGARVPRAARALLRRDPRDGPGGERHRHGSLAARLDEPVERAARLPARRRQGVSRLRPHHADHGSAVGASVPEPREPDRRPRCRLRQPRPLRRAEPRPREAGGLRRLQRHRAADDAERPHVHHRRDRLADRHDEVRAATSTPRTSGS